MISLLHCHCVYRSTDHHKYRLSFLQVVPHLLLLSMIFLKCTINIVVVWKAASFVCIPLKAGYFIIFITIECRNAWNSVDKVFGNICPGLLYLSWNIFLWWCTHLSVNNLYLRFRPSNRCLNKISYYYMILIRYWISNDNNGLSR